jgi:hypothetical protein
MRQMLGGSKTSCAQQLSVLSQIVLESIFHPNLKRPFQLLIAFLGCLHLCGGPAGLLQGIAWVKMSVEYSAQDGVVVGLKKTFDGEHPCAMCRVVAQAKQAEQNSTPVQAPSSDKDLKVAKDLSPMDTIEWPTVLRPEILLASLRPVMMTDAQSGRRPPVPPPRMA